MKQKIILLSLVVSLLLGMSDCLAFESDQTTTKEDPIKILTSPELHSLVSTWVNEFHHDDTEMTAISLSPAELAQQILEKSSIAIIADNSASNLKAESFWKISLGREIYVPVMHQDNPFADQILAQGISAEVYKEILTKPGIANWGSILNNENTAAVECYGIDQTTFISCLSEFIQSEIADCKNGILLPPTEILSAIHKHKNAIAFCRLADLIDPNNHSLAENLVLIPIDVNQNYTVDHFEDFYGNVNDFARGVWIGKYPTSLYQSIQYVCHQFPADKEEQAFIEWLLSGGQEYLGGNGFSNLLRSESLAELQNLKAPSSLVLASAPKPASATIIILIALAFALVVSLLVSIIRFFRSDKKDHSLKREMTPNILNEETVQISSGLSYYKSHTWAFMEKNGSVKIGVDDFISRITGRITKVKMKVEGEKVKKGEAFVTIIQQGKQLNIYSPVSGTIIKQNANLEKNSSLINSSPYTDGWIYMIQPDQWLKEISLSMMAIDYKNWLKKEFSRFKDFLANTVESKKGTLSMLALQDGGEITEHLLERMNPQTWEEFQTGYIDLFK